MVQPGGADIHAWDYLCFYLGMERCLHGVGMHPNNPLRDRKSQVFCKRNSHHRVADIYLVTQADCLDFAETVDGVADSCHGIRKINVPGLRAVLLHIAVSYTHLR